jgi:hypothetical protein
MQPCVGGCTYLEEYRWTEIRRRCSFEHAIECLSPHAAATERCAHAALERFTVRLEVFSRLLVQRVRRVRLEE